MDTPVEDPESEVVLRLHDVQMHGLHLPKDTPGVLSITRRHILWSRSTLQPSDRPNPPTHHPSEKTLIPIADIGLHAISRESTTDFGPSIYIQVGDSDDELRIIPPHPATELDAVWDALCLVSTYATHDDDDDDHHHHEDRKIDDPDAAPPAHYGVRDYDEPYYDDLDDNDEPETYADQDDYEEFADAEEEDEEDENHPAAHASGRPGRGLGGYSILEHVNRLMEDSAKSIPLSAAADRTSSKTIVDALQSCHIDSPRTAENKDNPLEKAS